MLKVGAQQVVRKGVRISAKIYAIEELQHGVAQNFTETFHFEEKTPAEVFFKINLSLEACALPVADSKMQILQIFYRRYRFSSHISKPLWYFRCPRRNVKAFLERYTGIHPDIKHSVKACTFQEGTRAATRWYFQGSKMIATCCFTWHLNTFWSFQNISENFRGKAGKAPLAHR